MVSMVSEQKEKQRHPVDGSTIAALTRTYKVELVKLEHFGNLLISARAKDARNDRSTRRSRDNPW